MANNVKLCVISYISAPCDAGTAYLDKLPMFLQFKSNREYRREYLSRFLQAVSIGTNEWREMFTSLCFIDTKVAFCRARTKKKASSDELAFCVLVVIGGLEPPTPAL